MTAINHAVTGAIIGLVSGQPLLAVPAALLSHFICDALPHFGSDTPGDEWIKSDIFRKMLMVDGGLCVFLVLGLAIVRPEHWLLASICAFVATSPDLVWLRRFVDARRGTTWRANAFERFTAWIQWYEHRWGALVEATWLVLGLVVLSDFVR